MVVVLTGMCAYPEIAVTRVGTDDGFSEVYNPVCEGGGPREVTSRHGYLEGRGYLDREAEISSGSPVSDQ